MKSKRIQFFIIIGISMYSSFSYAQTDSIVINNEITPRCTLVVKTDCNDTLNVWINNRKFGKTPLEIDSLPPGFYDISFIKQTLRDSILNLGICIPLNRDEYINNSNSHIFFSIGDLARESNVKFILKNNEKKEIYFHIQEIRKDIKNKIIQRWIYSTAVTVCLAVVLIIRFTLLN
jgi:hypothetical protein